MSSTKVKRDRLFKGGRPLVRQFDPAKDFWVLWAAYDLGSFPGITKGLSMDQFKAVLTNSLSRHSAALVVEDQCKWFRDKRGPIALVTVDNFGWRVEPFADFFIWTTPRMKARAVVSFLQMVRYDSDVGVCVGRVPERFFEFYNRLREYGVMFPCGKIPYGAEHGNEYLFYIHGKRKRLENRVNQDHQAAERQPEVLPAVDAVAEGAVA